MATQGPNTGGMGAYCDGRILGDFQKAMVMAQVIRPAIEHMRADGHAVHRFSLRGLDDDRARAESAGVQRAAGRSGNAGADASHGVRFRGAVVRGGARHAG